MPRLCGNVGFADMRTKPIAVLALRREAAVGHARPLPVSGNYHRSTGGTRNAPVAPNGAQEARGLNQLYPYRTRKLR